jgi:hypothetical protein
MPDRNNCPGSGFQLEIFASGRSRPLALPPAGGMGNWETGTRKEEAYFLVSSMLPLLCWASWAGMIPGAAWYVPPFRPTRNPEYPLLFYRP